MLDMKDHWKAKDWIRYYKMKKEAEKLKEGLKVKA